MNTPIPIRAGMSRFYCNKCKAAKCRHANVIICHGCGDRRVLPNIPAVKL